MTLLVLTKQWYIGILARIRINAFRIELAGGYNDLLSSLAASIEAEAAVGNAVYMLPSFYNHDCGKFFTSALHHFGKIVITLFLFSFSFIGTAYSVHSKGIKI